MAVETGNVEDIYELSPMQRGMLFHTLYAPHSGVYIEQTVYSLRGFLDVNILHSAWRQVIAQHPALRSAFYWEDLDEPLQVVYQLVQAPWEQFDWRELPPTAQHNQLEELLAADRQRGFDLAQPPLLRLVLTRIDDDTRFLIFTYHHLLLDGWSLTIVVQEVFHLYESLLAGREPQFKPRRPYRDYIAWLRNQNLAEAEAFWRRYLQGFTTPTPIPIDRSSSQDHRETSPAGQPASGIAHAQSLAENDELQLRGGRPVELQSFTLSRQTTAALFAFIRRYQLTLNTLLQGAWALLLSRYSGGGDHSPDSAIDVVFGATVAGRPANLSGAEAMVGLFINTLPVRTSVTEQAELLPWLAQLQAQQAEAREYDFTPLVQVHGWSDVPREQSLFESLVVFENYHIESYPDSSDVSSGQAATGQAQDLPLLDVRALQTLEQTNYPLVLIIAPGAELKVQLGYETARFSPGAIRRALDFLRLLLESFIAHPHSRLADFSLLNDAERRQILASWHRPATSIAHAQDFTLCQLFQRQAASAPEAIALVAYEYGNQRDAQPGEQHRNDSQWTSQPSSVLTYAELDQRANQLAHYLLKAGVGPEVRVGLCMERSPQLLISLLAILKAGSVFLPLDPAYPQERLAFLLADAQAPVVLTQRHLLPLLSGPRAQATSATVSTLATPTPATIICVDDERATIEQQPATSPHLMLWPGNAAYIIYTSGSTGTPKGVVVTHQSLLNHCVAVGRRYQLRATDRVLQFASMGFDVALEEILPSWLAGAAVVLWPDLIAPAPAEFSRFLAQEQLTALNIPSSYWHAWVSELARPRALRPTALRLVIVGSEKVSAAHLVDWRSIIGHRVSWRNAYGLTETAITSLIYEPENADPEQQSSSVPIGKPLDNVEAYLLDTHVQPAPIGMPGELYIGGAGLARGYLHRADLTAERFLPHPFSDTPGARLYRTGDLARYQRDGNIEFLGRADSQVKVRGFRIELGEIEALLNQHASVSDAVVIAREDTPNDTRLVAYVVPASGQSRMAGPTFSDGGALSQPVATPAPPSTSLLRAYLRRRLPPYMVPTTFVLLDTLPRNPSGKVNRRALPAPERAQARAIEAYIAPRTPLEELLTVIWSSVLRLERVSRADHFFKLGGHSLQATQVVARLREVLQLELPVRAIYDAPTISALALAIETLRQSATGTVIPPLKRVERKATLPLSFAQQRIWFLDQLQPGNPAYTMPFAFSVRGSLDIAAVEHALNNLVQRHEMLRTHFTMLNEQPVQIIAPTLHLRMPVVYLASHPELARRTRAELARLLREEARRPFDLQHGPLVRATLVRLHAREHVLLLTLHHIIADGWSADIFFNELNLFYTASTTGQPASLPDLPVQYVDYAVWQRQWLSPSHASPAADDSPEQGASAVFETQLAYWRQQLLGAPARLELPTDHPRPAVQTLRGAYAAFALPVLLTQQLQALCREEGVTLFMLLLAAFQLLLARYSKQTDIVVGVPTAGRVQRATEGLIGLFLNTLALRTDLSGDISFRELLGRVREVSLGAYMRQDLPFEKLIEELQPERNLSQSPLFQVFFNFQNMFRRQPTLSGLPLEPLDTGAGTAKFDLTLELVETPTGLQGTLEYNADLFEAATVERMIDHYRTLVASIVADSEQPITSIPLLKQAERQQMLQTWNDTSQTYASDSTLHALFEAQALRVPQRVALVCEDTQLTFGELNSRANQLAHCLQQLRTSSGEPIIRPETRIGLCMQRSVELVIALFAILKAACAYIPLDPDYPLERLAFIVQDAGIPVLVTQQSLVGRLPTSSATTLCLDTAWQTIATQSRENPCSYPLSRNLAYVIYTSGSTGQPKGVAIEHRSVVNFLTSMRSQPGLGEQDHLLALTSLSFDIAGLEIYLPLINGARLEMATRAVATDGRLLAQRLVTSGATIAQATPSAWRMLLDAAWPDVCQLTLLCGGESLPLPLAHALLTQGVSLWNMYGPTETTIWSTLSHIVAAADAVTIGRPIANTQLYILDAYLNPIPIGVSGDLYIGGDGLSRGYLGRPDLTAEKFIPDPYSSVPGARLYQTGDLARYLADGQVEFLGRADTQVKLRGFRIELGEIEAALSQRLAVQSVAVLLRADRPGDQRLVAYVVTRAEQTLTAADLQQHLQQRLPPYMLPSTFVWLPALPLTPNGKIDRRALPAPDQSNDAFDETPQTARTPLEELLAVIWSDILGKERVGLHENFFDLGGHSLLATQIIGRIRTTLSVDLPLRALFETPTIFSLARQIELARWSGEHPQLQPSRPLRRELRTDLPLSFAQQRLWFLDQLTPNSSVYILPAAWRLQGPLKFSALARSLDALVMRHESLRTYVVVQDGQPVQKIAPASPLALSLLDLTALPAAESEHQAQQLGHDLASLPFNLAQGPLLRVYLLRLAEHTHWLLATFHHIITDGWSMGIFFQELAFAYHALLTGEPLSLPPLPLQYGDYALWQREWLQGQALELQLSYWRQQLEGAPTLLNLPTDFPRPALQTSLGASYSFALSPELSQALTSLSRLENVTLFMTLLTAFALLLSRYSGQDDLIIGTPIANRVHQETENLIGFFVNTLPLRVNLSHATAQSLAGSPTVHEVLASVREVALGAYAHQDFPFERLVDTLQLERDLSYTPLFQVMFVLQNAAGAPLTLPELQVNRLEIESGTVGFDLTLFMEEIDQGHSRDRACPCPGLVGTLDYNLNLFASSSIERMVEHLGVLLASMVANPHQHIADLPMLTAQDRQQVLLAWNDTRRDIGANVCLHTLFEQQVERAPDAIALVYAGEHLSYHELNARANQLAHYVQRLGVGPETTVGLCLQRSIELVIALLGVLKAGGAYVPLDPTYPPERLAFLLQDAQVTVLITRQQHIAGLPAQEASVVLMERAWPAIAQESAGQVTSGALPANPAYVIYTSGSTGQPKGVSISHHAISNHMLWMHSAFPLAATDRLLQKTPYSFDASVWEFYAPLLTGACLVIARPDGHLDSAYMLETIAREHISMLQLVPTMLRILLDEPAIATCQSLRHVFSGGEELTRELQDYAWTRLPQHTALTNLYGPTECTIDSIVWTCERHLQRQRVPIGRPITNTQVYILDRHLHPLPVAVPGELYIGGAGMARGYLHRPELTAERFIPHPFSQQPGARLYKTGDRARYLPTGDIEYLGRTDSQVKLRGFRIELGEIETVLSQHPALQDCVVVLREDGPTQQRLVAYVVARQEQAAAIGDLRAYLQQRLPDHMVPSRFVVLETFPLAPNGKVDRRALPAPDSSRPALAHDYFAPQTPAEALLASIWAEVLRLNQISIHDNFFALGGDSILSLQIVAKANAAGLPLTPRHLFQYQTIAQLAVVAGTATSAIHAEQGLVRGSVPLIPIQHWFFEQALPASHHWNQAFLLQACQPLNPSIIHQAVHALLLHHDALRLCVQYEPDGRRLYHADPVSPDQAPFLHVDLSAIAPSARSSTLEATAARLQASLDLKQGPLLRVALFTAQSQQPAHLLLIIHHLVVDIVSWQILLDDLQLACQQVIQGQPIRLPPKTTSFQHWAQRLLDYAQSDELLRKQDFWLSQPWDSIYPLPQDTLATSANVEDSARTVAVTLTEEETQALLTEVPGVYHTQITEVLLTALVQAFAAWTGRSSLLVQLEGHGREDLLEGIDLTRTMGWFTTLAPVVLSLPSMQGSGPGQALKDIKEQVRRVPQHGFSFGLLRYLCQDERLNAALAALPQPEVVFNYGGRAAQAPDHDRLFVPVAVGVGGARDPHGPRPYVLEIDAGIADAQLYLEWTYSQQLHQRTTIERLAQDFLEALRALIRHCQSPEAGGYTPADFPEAALSQDALDALIAELAQTLEEG